MQRELVCCVTTHRCHCDFTDTPFSFILQQLLKVDGGAAESQSRRRLRHCSNRRGNNCLLLIRSACRMKWCNLPGKPRGTGLPIVAETYDGQLSIGLHDSLLQPILEEHVFAALDHASSESVVRFSPRMERFSPRVERFLPRVEHLPAACLATRVGLAGRRVCRWWDRDGHSGVQSGNRHPHCPGRGCHACHGAFSQLCSQPRPAPRLAKLLAACVAPAASLRPHAPAQAPPHDLSTPAGTGSTQSGCWCRCV